jgi:peptidoglycan-associated lipoprotein
MKRQIFLTALLTTTIALAGCKTAAPEELPPQQAVVVPAAEPTAAPAATGPVVGTQSHFVNAVNGQNVVFFDTDRYNIDSADAAALQTQAQYLMRYANITVTIEGHTDERGTRDYNIALGERRANSAKNYLVGLGVPSNRIATVSYGKERPTAMGSNAEAWAQNRRAVSVVIN